MLGATGGKNAPSFELQILLYNSVQLSEQATDMDDMNTGEDMMGKCVDASVCRQHSPPASTPSPKICLFGCSAPAIPQLATPSASVIPAWGYYRGSGARRLWLEYDHYRWGHNRSKGHSLWPDQFRVPVLRVSFWTVAFIIFCVQ